MHILSKISLVSTLILLIATIAHVLGIIGDTYNNAIIYSMAAVQIILFVLFVTMVIVLVIKKNKMCTVKIRRCQISDKMVKSNIDILPEHVHPTNPRKSALFRVFLALENVKRTPEIGISHLRTGCPNDSGKNDISKNIGNINVDMVDDNLIFGIDIIVRPDEEINFYFKQDADIKLFLLEEFYVP